ncbi:hypothetical protein [Actinomadura alba]|uniref:hypothetical protein n=1 Tax=Actinomadura alba TaxID=406431 RepID=UPI0031D00FAF
MILDHTALSALGAGNRGLSRLVAEPHRTTEDYVVVPALCLAAATVERPALADHVGSLPAINVVELDFSGAAAVGHLINDGADWRMAHAVHVARPNVEWPDGCTVFSSSPDQYRQFGIPAIPVSSMN